MMAGGDLPQGRRLGAATRLRVGAAGVKMATGRRPQGTGQPSTTRLARRILGSGTGTAASKASV